MTSFLRHGLRLIAALAIVAAVIAFYFRVVSVNNTTIALTLLIAIFGISAGWGLTGSDHRLHRRRAGIQLLLPAAGRNL